MAYTSVRFTPGFRQIDGSDLNTAFAQIANSSQGFPSGVDYFVNETIGSDNSANTGTNPYQPLKTLDRALVLESAATNGAGNRNSCVYFWGTQHRTSSLVWNLPQTHLIGLCAGQLRGKRARISVSGSTGFNKLVQVTAAGCNFSNLGTFYGWSNSSSALLCWSDEAGRSCYDNVEFLGFGDGTVSTGSSNLTGSRALKFSGVGETTWQNCVFGVDTEARNATNYTVEIAASPGAPRMSFIDCVFEAQLGSSGTAASHILIGASGIDRYLDIVRCRFHGFGSAMAQALNISSSAGGTVLLDQSSFSSGITAWQGTPTTNVQMNMTSPSSGGGKAITNA